MMGQRTWILDKFVFVFSQSWRTMHISLFFMWVWFLAKFDMCWGPFFCPAWHYFISNPHHINILFIFWVNLFKAQNKLISHGLGSHGPQDPYFKRQIHGPQFLFINWDHNPPYDIININIWIGLKQWIKTHCPYYQSYTHGKRLL